MSDPKLKQKPFHLTIQDGTGSDTIRLHGVGSVVNKPSVLLDDRIIISREDWRRIVLSWVQLFADQDARLRGSVLDDLAADRREQADAETVEERNRRVAENRSKLGALERALEDEIRRVIG